MTMVEGVVCREYTLFRPLDTFNLKDKPLKYFDLLRILRYFHFLLGEGD